MLSKIDIPFIVYPLSYTAQSLSYLCEVKSSIDNSFYQKVHILQVFKLNNVIFNDQDCENYNMNSFQFILLLYLYQSCITF